MHFISLILGLIFLSIGIAGFIPSAPSPKHGDTRIRKFSDDQYWLEEYVAYPKWHMSKFFRTLEEAKAAKAKADRVVSEPVVIE